MPKRRSHDGQEIEENSEVEQIPFLTASNQQNGFSSAQRTPLIRQSSISQPGAARTPRTANRVRFDIQEPSDASGNNTYTSNDEEEEWLNGEDYVSGGRRSSTAQRAPLLTGVEAPSVTTALEIDVDELLESARPKSGLSSAFMNMANSIIGAGIIGTVLTRRLEEESYSLKISRATLRVQTSWHGYGSPFAGSFDCNRR